MKTKKWQVCAWMVLAGLAACMPVHQFEQSYEMPYGPQELHNRMTQMFRMVKPPDPDDIRPTEVALYLDNSLQAITLITDDSLRGTLLTLRMVMWEDGRAVSEAEAVRLFEARVVQPLLAAVDTPPMPADSASNGRNKPTPMP